MFITYEGIEGSGKSTQIKLLADYLEGMGKNVVVTREPGGSHLGRGLRSILLDCRQSKIVDRAELCLFLADRAQHIEEVIGPALEAGNVVLCDRFVDSTIAYQGYGRGMNIEELWILNRLVAGPLLPHLTFLLNLPVHTGLARAGLRNQQEGTVISEGRFDAESLVFHNRVQDGYLKLAESDPGRIKVIDADKAPEVIFSFCLSFLPEDDNLI